MKYIGLTIMLTICILFSGQAVYAQCDGVGRINGIFHTSCFTWNGGSPDFDGYITGTSRKSDTGRLRRAIAKAFGKLVFDERDYFIDDELTVYSYRILEGTGRSVYEPIPLPSPVPTPSPTPGPEDYTSRIIQTAEDKAIFRIGEGARAISIRDMTLMGQTGKTGTIGILMEGGNKADPLAALYFQFSNLNFNNLKKGIYVNALDDAGNKDDTEGYWQADNIRLDHAAFEGCQIGIHINSNNSGWNMTSLEFIVPPGDEIDAGKEGPEADGKTYAVFLERSAYTNMDLLIGNGTEPPPKTPPVPATAMIYVGQHGNLSIRNIIDEGFRNSVYIQGGDRTSPIHLMNNYFQSPVTINNSTVVSTANQFHMVAEEVQGRVTGGSQVYSYGDKFCFEGYECDYYHYVTYGSDAQIVTRDDQYESVSTVPNFINFGTESEKLGLSIFSPANPLAGAYFLRLQQGEFMYDISRNYLSGALTFKGSQDDHSGYSFETNNGGKVVINNDGSVTYGTVTYANLWSAAANGTVVYCSNCTRTTSCASGGGGALAQRINSAWYCD